MAISPKHDIVKKTTTPTAEYAIKVAAGPATFKALPVPIKRPVPKEPPMAIMDICRLSKFFFNYFVNVVSICGVLSWISILITYICFDRAVKAQGIDKSTFAYVAPWQPYGAYFALFFCCLLALIKNFTVFLNHKFDHENFITGYIGLPIFFICYFGFKWWKKTRIIPPLEVDLYTFKAAIDQEEEDGKIEDEKLQERLKNGKKDWEWFYETYLGKIF